MNGANWFKFSQFMSKHYDSRLLFLYKENLFLRDALQKAEIRELELIKKLKMHGGGMTIVKQHVKDFEALCEESDNKMRDIYSAYRKLRTAFYMYRIDGYSECEAKLRCEPEINIIKNHLAQIAPINESMHSANRDMVSEFGEIRVMDL